MKGIKGKPETLKPAKVHVKETPAKGKVINEKVGKSLAEEGRGKEDGGQDDLGREDR